MRILAKQVRKKLITIIKSLKLRRNLQKIRRFRQITVSQTEASLKDKSTQVVVEKTDKCSQTRCVPLNERSVQTCNNTQSTIRETQTYSHLTTEIEKRTPPENIRFCVPSNRYSSTTPSTSKKNSLQTETRSGDSKKRK
ncbi:hypothetical protein CDAR_102861 [Caerostris darwini]|uniref:Uncharacterized protein n=1 Tax=Caerostris darwini TaxID=1538125 RepID=A0AAV4WSV9_9ARAC|nr:hypothetical protein CDAR_102861 [Caerostris darwini]